MTENMKNPDAPRMEIVKITPELAETYLGKNTRNRPIKDQHVRTLAAAIERGEWQMNGETIIFDDHDSLLDGQHRLRAVVLAGVPIETLVVWGIRDESQVTMDTGSKRSLSDVLALAGETNASTLAGALSQLHRATTGRQMAISGQQRLTHTQGLALLGQHPNIRNSIPVAGRCSRALRCSPSLAAYLHYYFSSINPGDADFFFEKLISGSALDESSPIYTLRKMLERESTSIRRTSVPRVHAMWIKAWNAYREGRELRQLRFAPGGSAPEAFPVAI